MKKMTDEQQNLVALTEYNDYKVGQSVKINGYGKVGYVSQVIDNQDTGEFTYVVTDKNVAKGASANDVKNVTIISRGSAFDFSSPQQRHDTAVDWIKNNIPVGLQILSDDVKPIPFVDLTWNDSTMPQMRSSSKTVDTNIEKYKNADFSLYGHSQGSMNVQYAAVNTKYPSKIKSVHAYEGPNIYSLLNGKQKHQAKEMKNRIFNIIDPKDIVPFGNRSHQKAVGQVIRAKTKWKKNPIDQHMMKGYQFKNGKLIAKSSIIDKILNPDNWHLSKKNKKPKKRSTKKVSKQVSSNSKLNKLTTKTLKQKFGAGGLSDSQQILLDAVYAREATQSALTDITAKTTEFKKMYIDAIKEANELWDDTVAQAAMMGPHLSKAEQLAALASAGFTESEIKTQPVAKYQSKITQLTAFQSKYETLLEKIDNEISKQVSGDQELSRMFAL